jgi:hypothetical protein
MSNRRKSAPTDVRSPLLAALGIEYARASKAKNLARMEEIAAIVAAINGVPPSHEIVPVPVITAQPAVPEPDLEPEPIPLPSAAELPPVPVPATLQDILTRAGGFDEPSDSERRRAAREAVQQAVRDVNRLTSDDQFRMELALLAANGNIQAMADMRDLAAIAGLTVEGYAKRTIAIHNARRRRAAQIYALEEQALRDIAAASGNAIQPIADQAIEAIKGDDA